MYCFYQLTYQRVIGLKDDLSGVAIASPSPNKNEKKEQNGAVVASKVTAKSSEDDENDEGSSEEEDDDEDEGTEKKDNKPRADKAPTDKAERKVLRTSQSFISNEKKNLGVEEKDQRGEPREKKKQNTKACKEKTSQNNTKGKEAINAFMFIEWMQISG